MLFPYFLSTSRKGGIKPDTKEVISRKETSSGSNSVLGRNDREQKFYMESHLKIESQQFSSKQHRRESFQLSTID